MLTTHETSPCFSLGDAGSTRSSKYKKLLATTKCELGVKGSVDHVYRGNELWEGVGYMDTSENTSGPSAGFQEGLEKFH